MEEDAKRAVAAKAAETAEAARRAAETKGAEKARRAEEAERVTQAAAAKRAAKVRKANKPVRKGRRRRAPCRNAGVRVRGGGWYVVQVGDTLWGIARTHYGHGIAYHRIHAANRRRIANPHLIYPCQRIYIPRARAGRATVQDLWQALASFVRGGEVDGRLPGSTGDSGLNG